MDDPAGEGSFHDVEPIVLDVLQQGGDVPNARFALWHRLLVVARETVGERGPWLSTAAT